MEQLKAVPTAQGDIADVAKASLLILTMADMVAYSASSPWLPFLQVVPVLF